MWLSYGVVPTLCLIPLIAVTLLYGYEGYGKGLLASYWLYFLVPIMMIAVADIINGFYYAVSEKSVPGRMDDVLYLGAYCVSVAAALAVLKSPLEKASVIPSIEEHVLKGKGVKIREGRGSIVEDPHSNISFELFSRLLKSDNEEGRRQGYIVSRRNPDHIRQQFQLGDSRIAWITSQPGDGHMDPTRPNMLAHSVVEAFQKNRNTVVLIDGIESIVAYNDFNKAMKMLEQINDFVMQYRGFLIVPIDPMAFDQREKAIMERNFDIVKVTG